MRIPSNLRPITTSLFLTASLLLSVAPVPTSAATAPKKTTNGSSFEPGQYVNIEIQAKTPSASTSITPVEIMVALDLSGSVNAQTTDTKQKLTTFANGLSSKLGKARVGIYKFGSGSGGFTAKTIATAKDLSDLKQAINNLEAGQSGVGTSNILRGMQDANAGFTNNSTKKYLVLITDGYANHPYSQGGRCPIKITNSYSTRAPSIALRSTDFHIVHITSDDYSMKLAGPGEGGGYDPCGGTQYNRGEYAYVNWRYTKYISNQYCLVGENSAQGTPACEMLREMESVYPNATKQSTIQPAINGVNSEIDRLSKVASISVNERLNSNIFDTSAGISSIRVVRCGTSTTIGSSALIPGSNLTLTGNIKVTNDSETNYCIQFRAKVKNNPSIGQNLDINTSSNTIRYNNSVGSTLQTDTIAKGTITITDPYVAPKNLTTSSLECQSVRLSWTAGAGVNSYKVLLTPNTGGHNPRSAGTATSLNITGLNPSTSYTWQLIATTSTGDKPAVSGPRFTTPPCKEFTTSAPAGTIVKPGGGSAIQNINLNYLPNTATWGNGQVTVKVVAVLSGSVSASTCQSTYSPSSPAVTSGTGAASGITLSLAHLTPSVRGGDTFAANSRDRVAVELEANQNVTQGTYSMCIASSSTDGKALNPMIARTFTVQYTSWLQVSGSDTSRSAGDIHSNGPVSFNVPPGNFLFAPSLSGIISSSAIGGSSLNVMPTRLSEIVSWRVANYPRRINSPVYEELLKTVATRKGSVPILTNLSSSSGAPQLMPACAANQTKAYHVKGDLTINNTSNLTNSNCAKANVVYFIDGNLTIKANQTINSRLATVTYIVQGDIAADSSVEQLDGMYVFAGTFRDGAGSRPLEVKGSLIGLSGHTPASSTGSFVYNNQPSLQRNLQSSNQNPAETIIYQPKYLIQLTPLLGSTSISWTEEE